MYSKCVMLTNIIVFYVKQMNICIFMIFCIKMQTLNLAKRLLNTHLVSHHTGHIYYLDVLQNIPLYFSAILVVVKQLCN